MTAFRVFWEARLTDGSWPLCRAMHNGHYAESSIMHSSVAESVPARGLT